MAIKMTMHNNDYSEPIEQFLGNFYLNMRRLDRNATMEDMDNVERITRLLNPNVTKVWTEDDKQFLEKNIKNKFLEYIQKTKFEDFELSSDLDYIEKSLEISFVDSVIDKWANGEDCYWFFNSGGRVITL